MKCNGEKNRNEGTSLGAMAVPLLQAASGCSWLTVLLTGGLCTGILWGIEKLSSGRAKPKWIALLQMLWAMITLSETMHWSRSCWQGTEAVWAVPLVLIILAAWVTGKGKEISDRAASLLRYFLIGLLGIVLLSAVKEIRLENLRPGWQLKDGSLITVFFLLALSPESEKNDEKGKTLLCALLFSAVTTGVLSLRTSRETAMPFYEMSRSLSFSGTVKRFESLASSAMTMGYFLLYCYLLNVYREEGRTGRNIKWGMAAAASCLYVSGLRINSIWLAVAGVIVAAVLPTIGSLLGQDTGEKGDNRRKNENIKKKA